MYERKNENGYEHCCSCDSGALAFSLGECFVEGKHDSNLDRDKRSFLPTNRTDGYLV